MRLQPSMAPCIEARSVRSPSTTSAPSRRRASARSSSRRTKARTLCPLASRNSVRLRPMPPTAPAAPVTRIGLSYLWFVVMSQLRLGTQNRRSPRRSRSSPWSCLRLVWLGTRRTRRRYCRAGWSVQFAQQAGQVHFRVSRLEAALECSLKPALGLGGLRTRAEEIGIVTKILDWRESYRIDAFLDCDEAGGRKFGDAMRERCHEIIERAGGQRPIDPAVPLSQLRVVILCAQHDFERT